MKKILLILALFSVLLQADIKDRNANDVYALAETLKNKFIHLAGEKKIDARYMQIEEQKNKSPRHVLQKTLEVLQKINKYRQNNNLLCHWF